MNTVCTLFELYLKVSLHEPETRLGVFSSQALATAARDSVVANWRPTTGSMPELEQFRICPVEVLTQVPEFHFYQATIELENPEDTRCASLDCPQAVGSDNAWVVDHDRQQAPNYYNHPMARAVATGRTPADALARAREVHTRSIQAGALEHLLQHRRRRKAAEELAGKRALHDSRLFHQLRAEAFNEVVRDEQASN
jgi:hypothetical protein